MPSLKDYLDSHRLTRAEMSVTGLRVRVMEAKVQTSREGQHGPYTRQGIKLTDDTATSYATIWAGPAVKTGDQLLVTEGRISTRSRDGKEYINFDLRGGKFQVLEPAAPAGAASGGSQAMTFEEYWDLYGRCVANALRTLNAYDVALSEALPLGKDMATSAMIAYVRDRAFQLPPKEQVGKPEDYDPGAQDDDLPF